MTSKSPVDLTGAAKTMLTTLYLKSLDAGLDRPVLGDTFARDAVRALDFDWSDLGVTATWTPIVTVRTAQYDIWTAEFLDSNPTATVVHIGCGLDARVFRLDPAETVTWIDADFPEVIDIRQQIYPDRPGYRLLATSATDSSWLEEIPTDAPVLFLAEGISMYLTHAEGTDLLRRVVDRFSGGEIQIDFYNWLAVKSQRVHMLNRRSGSVLHWAVNSPDDVLDAVPGLTLVDDVNLFTADTFDRVVGPFRAADTVTRAVPPVRNALQYHRYAF